MARTRQLSDLRNDVRVRCDLVGSAFPQDSEINELVNQGWAELYDLYIESGEQYFLTVTNPISLTSDTLSLTANAPDFYQLRGVDINVGGSQWMNAHRFQIERRNDWNSYQGVGGWAWPFDVRYDIWGSNIKFVPAPSGTQSVRLLYYPAPVRMVADSDSIDGVAGWERYVVDWAARQVAERDDNYDLAQSIAIDLERMRQRIVNMASRRNAGEAPKARMVRGRLGTFGGLRRWWGW